MRKKKIIVIFGTRPEAIKLAPVIKELKRENQFKTIVASTGQHREMLNQVLEIFRIKIDYNIDLMKSNQDLYDITVSSLLKLREVFKIYEPDLVLVQGDTTTAFISALAAFYDKIPVGHVEAGLRSYNIFSPFPEEANRRFISVLAHFNFAPTKPAKENLLKEGIKRNQVYTTGNTVVDALMQVRSKLAENKLGGKIRRDLSKQVERDIFSRKYILITLHRREKFGDELRLVLESIKELAIKYPDYDFVYPVHLNPNVKSPVESILSNLPNVILLPPLDYLKFVYLMSKCHFILSDSGGIQEECFVFKKPILVLRDVTEREEAIKAGYAFLVGSSKRKILKYFKEIDSSLMSGQDYFNVKNPFGDGKAAVRIVDLIKKKI
jgi:UDP-N-acetylglucosamine 2-epimerase (non-hydrolysing)